MKYPRFEVRPLVLGDGSVYYQLWLAINEHQERNLYIGSNTRDMVDMADLVKKAAITITTGHQAAIEAPESDDRS